MHEALKQVTCGGLSIALTNATVATALSNSIGDNRMSALKIGLLLDDKFSSKYVYELVDWAQQQPNLEISHLIIYPSPAISIFKKIGATIDSGGISYWATILLFHIIISAEKMLLKFSRLHKRHFGAFDLSGKVKEKIIITPIISRPGLCYQFSSDDVGHVKALHLDLLIRCGAEELRGDILTASRLGVVALNCGNNEIYGGKLACFWECYYRRPKTGFIIHKLAGDLGASHVLRSGFFSTQYAFSLNQANLYRKASPHFQNFLQEIAATGRLPEGEIVRPYSEKPLRLPRFHQGIAYIFKIIGRISVKVLFRSIKFRKRWSVSFVRSNWKNAVLWKSISAHVPRGHFWADPFVYAHGEKTYCFVEDYVYKTKRGHISVLEITNRSVVELGECIKEPFHLSFPFLFHYEGQLYMCPECSESNQIRVYRCTDFPFSWELSNVIMDGVSAADTMLFEHDGMWWMLTSIDKSRSNDFCSELYLFYSSSPLKADWTAHPKNPIRIDPDGGRNAGLILEDGKIFRLAQRHGYDQYGESLLMYEITELSTSTYAEQLFSEVTPSFKSRLLGIHHLSTTGAITVFDHKSYSFF